MPVQRNQDPDYTQLVTDQPECNCKGQSHVVVRGAQTTSSSVVNSRVGLTEVYTLLGRIIIHTHTNLHDLPPNISRFPQQLVPPSRTPASLLVPRPELALLPHPHRLHSS